MRQQGGIASAQLIEGARRGMRVALLKESDRLEHSLSMLATVGSTSPYVGLFGTVWGIMNAFHGLGNVQQATLAMVAPGIAEALIATAMGLFAAIPAVIAYNRYADQVSRIELRYDTFVEELSTILQRHATRAARRPARPLRRRTHDSRTRRGRKLMAEINVVPYIDVMLVLLIIFMVTAPLLTQGIKVDLPKAGAEPLPQELMREHQPLILSVDTRAASFYLNIGKDEESPIDEDAVVERVSTVLRREPKTPVLVKADQNVPYGRVVDRHGAAAAGRRGESRLHHRSGRTTRQAALKR